MQLSIIVPCFKEGENLKVLLPEIHKVMSPQNYSYEIIVVDDNSRDGSIETVSENAAKNIPVKILVRECERGLSSAVIHGMNKAKGDILLCMDGDMSHHPKFLPSMLKPFLADPQLDFVIGSRFTEGGEIDKNWSLYRHLNSRMATFLCRPLIDHSINDPMAGFFAIQKKRTTIITTKTNRSRSNELSDFFLAFVLKQY